MHEVAIANEIMDLVLKKAEEHNAAKVTKIKLMIGELTSIVPEALDFAFVSITPGTPLQGVKVVMKKVKLKGKCGDCNKEFRIKHMMYICPKCRGTNIKILSGKEMIIQSIDME
jgi:hydrogenase nickel incorporation protein HypA/HybF